MLLALAGCAATPQGVATQGSAAPGSVAPGSAAPATAHNEPALPLTPAGAKSEDVPATPQGPNPVTATAKILRSANDSFEYKVGNPNFQGRTLVRVTGDGLAEASFERGGKTQHYKGPAPAAKLQALRRSLAKQPIDGYKTAKRNPVPDEATMQFVLVTGGKRTEASYLNGDRYSIEALGDLVEVIQDIASKVSGGKIEY
jgi:hypothetical protein